MTYRMTNWPLIACLISLLCLFGSPSVAQNGETIITPEEFETLSQSKTLFFYRDGQIYGAEQFFKGRQSTWKFADGECDRGIWFPKGDQICFQYQANPGTQCWHFLKTKDGFSARFLGNEPSLDLKLRTINRAELICDYPDLNS